MKDSNKKRTAVQAGILVLLFFSVPWGARRTSITICSFLGGVPWVSATDNIVGLMSVWRGTGNGPLPAMSAACTACGRWVSALQDAMTRFIEGERKGVMHSTFKSWATYAPRQALGMGSPPGRGQSGVGGTASWKLWFALIRERLCGMQVRDTPAWPSLQKARSLHASSLSPCKVQKDAKQQAQLSRLGTADEHKLGKF